MTTLIDCGKQRKGASAQQKYSAHIYAMAIFSIDLTSRTPIYEQIYNKTVELILKGELAENDQLPSVRSLAKEINVNPNTIAKAYTQLEHDGIIYSLSGRGSFIADINSGAIKNYVLKDFDHCVSEAITVGITKTELKDRIDEATPKTNKKPKPSDDTLSQIFDNNKM